MVGRYAKQGTSQWRGAAAVTRHELDCRGNDQDCFSVLVNPLRASCLRAAIGDPFLFQSPVIDRDLDRSTDGSGVRIVKGNDQAFAVGCHRHPIGNTGIIGQIDDDSVSLRRSGFNIDPIKNDLSGWRIDVVKVYAAIGSRDDALTVTANLVRPQLD